MIPGYELRNLLYGTVFALASIFSVLIYDLLQFKRKKKVMSAASVMAQTGLSLLSRKCKILKPIAHPVFWVLFEIVILFAFQYLPNAFVNRPFGNLVGTGANYFGFLFFMHFLFVIMSIVVWVEPMKQIDLLAIPLPLGLMFDKLGCFSAGCCNGLWMPGGMYNYQTEREEVPIQLIEAGLALAIFIFLNIYRDKVKPGMLFPLYMLLYSGTRFVSEFWRGQELVLGPFRTYHILCFFGVILGIAGLIFVNKYGERITRYFENTIYFSRKLKDKQIQREKVLRS